MRQILLTVAWFATSLCTAGCAYHLGPWGGPAYELDPDKIGTGEQAILPRNDASYWNGEPMDYRSTKR